MHVCVRARAGAGACPADWLLRFGFYVYVCLCVCVELCVFARASTCVGTCVRAHVGGWLGACIVQQCGHADQTVCHDDDDDDDDERERERERERDACVGERKRCERGCLREKERYRCAATQTKRYVIRLGCAELCRIEKKGIRISSCRKKGNQDQIDLKGDGMLGLKIEGLGLNPKHTDLKGNEHWFHHGCFISIWMYITLHCIYIVFSIDVWIGIINLNPTP